MTIFLSELVYEESDAAQQAKDMGLTYKGFGRWADPSSDQITHKTVDGKLQPVSQAGGAGSMGRDAEPQQARPQTPSGKGDGRGQAPPSKGPPKGPPGAAAGRAGGQRSPNDVPDASDATPNSFSFRPSSTEEKQAALDFMDKYQPNAEITGVMSSKKDDTLSIKTKGAKASTAGPAGDKVFKIPKQELTGEFNGQPVGGPDFNDGLKVGDRASVRGEYPVVITGPSDDRGMVPFRDPKTGQRKTVIGKALEPAEPSGAEYDKMAQQSKADDAMEKGLDPEVGEDPPSQSKGDGPEVTDYDSAVDWADYTQKTSDGDPDTPEYWSDLVQKFTDKFEERYDSGDMDSDEYHQWVANIDGLEYRFQQAGGDLGNLYSDDSEKGGSSIPDRKFGEGNEEYLERISDQLPSEYDYDSFAAVIDDEFGGDWSHPAVDVYIDDTLEMVAKEMGGGYDVDTTSMGDKERSSVPAGKVTPDDKIDVSTMDGGPETIDKPDDPEEIMRQMGKVGYEMDQIKSAYERAKAFQPDKAEGFKKAYQQKKQEYKDLQQASRAAQDPPPDFDDSIANSAPDMKPMSPESEPDEIKSAIKSLVKRRAQDDFHDQAARFLKQFQGSPVHQKVSDWMNTAYMNAKNSNESTMLKDLMPKEGTYNVPNVDTLNKLKQINRKGIEQAKNQEKDPEDNDSDD